MHVLSSAIALYPTTLILRVGAPEAITTFTVNVHVRYPVQIMMSKRTLYQPTDEDCARLRHAAISWAQEVAGDAGAIFLDTETTGLDDRAEIIEISLLAASGDVLLDTLVRPQTRIPPDAQAVHGISNAMVADAPDWPDVCRQLLEIIEARRIVVYNAEFDFRMVSQMNRRHRLMHNLNTWQCAMQQYSGFAGVWHARYGNFRWHRLDDAVAKFGHPPGGHRALADARACKLVVDGMARSV